jgi:2-methylcitrate dehydratase
MMDGRVVSPVSDNLLRRLAAFGEACRHRPLSEPETEAMVTRLIDAMACAVIATGSTEFARLKAAFSDAQQPCHIIGGVQASLEHAAFLNSFLIRQQDWNDTYIGRNGGHPSDLIGGVLAAGEYTGKSGVEVLRAMAIGQHVMLDLCDTGDLLARGWDPSTYLGMASAVAVGVALDLSEAQLAQAISMTVVSGNILMGRTGKVSSWKALSSAVAVRNSLFYGLLAKNNMTAPDPVFEGPYGFTRHISGDLDLELDPRRDRTGDSHLKLYPAVYHAQGPIEAAMKIHRRMIEAFGETLLPTIESAHLDIYEFALRYAADAPDKWAPENVETADHSLPFLSAHVLMTGEYGPGSIERTLHDPNVRALAKKVTVRASPDFSQVWPKQTASRLTVVAAGRTFSEEIAAIIGHPIRPMSRETVLEKFMTCAGEPSRAKHWADCLLEFPRLASIVEAVTGP